MAALTSKERNEQAAFAKFVDGLGQADEWTEVTSRPAPEPDLLCIHVARGPIAFELVSLTDPSIAQVQGAGARARTDAFSTSDPSERIVRHKLHRSYQTRASHIELLVYTDGRIITPDDVLIPTILPWFDAIRHPFRTIWFMGESPPRVLWRAA
jgi:hypothetical protein